MKLYFIRVYVNDVLLGFVDAEGFFSKYGNNDGDNVIGLVAEAHVIKRLLEEGYEVKIIHSHNVEIREIRRGHLICECVRDYGEVIENMPRDLKELFRSLTDSGIRIRVRDNGRIPVYFEDKLLFRTSLKNVLRYLISKPLLLSFISPVFETDHEPFLLYLGWEIMLMLFYASSMTSQNGKLVKVLGGKTRGGVRYVKVENVNEVLDRVEEILEKLGILLVPDFWKGLNVSNKRSIEEEFKRLNEIVRLRREA
ncbi:MAG TPA: hypothetical protein ENF80_05035 [Thermofilum sp.]|nr:hypothetical protein [Thermofilum sp.]